MEILKRHLISVLITFLSSFLTVVLMAMEGANTFSDVAWPAVLIAAAFAGLREAVKLLLEAITGKLK